MSRGDKFNEIIVFVSEIPSIFRDSINIGNSLDLVQSLRASRNTRKPRTTGPSESQI